MLRKLLLSLALTLGLVAPSYGAGGLSYPGGLTTQSAAGCVRFDPSTNPVSFRSTGIACNTADTIYNKLFAQLGTPSNGTIYYCTNCNQATPCTTGGTGAFAERVAGVWQCASSGGGGGGTECSSSACSLNAATTLNGSTIQIGPLSGDVVTSGAVATIQANSVALGADTTGGYAASVSEAGPATTATALAANGLNCLAGNYALGVDASGNAEGCTAAASGTGDVSDVGPGCGTGACLTDGVATTGTTMFVWEGTSVDANEFMVAAPSANPSSDVTVTFPNVTGILASLATSQTFVGTQTVTGQLRATNSNTFFDTPVTGVQLSNLGSGASVIFDNSNDTFRGTGGGIVQANDVVCTGCVSLTSDVTGALPIANGGTNSTSLTPNECLRFNGTSIVSAGADCGSGSGTVVGLTADTGGQTTGSVVSIFGDLTGIDTARSTDNITISLDTTEVGSTTWGGGGNFTWTFNPAGATNPTIDFLNGAMVFTGPTINLTKNNADGVTLDGSTGVLSSLGSGSVRADNVTCSACIDLTSEITGTLPIANGGTGLASYTQGDIPYYVSGTALSKLAKDTNATRYLSNQGTSNAPSWNQVNAANGVTGVLPVANGGTNSSAGNILTLAGTSGSNQQLSAGDTLSIAAGTGITTTGGATDTVTVASTLGTSVDLTAEVTGTLPVANGGTGTASTLTGLMRGSGTAMTAAELSGDVSTSGSNVTAIGASKVTSSMIVNGTVAVADLASADFGSFTCNGTTCTLDTNTVTNAEVADNSLVFGDMNANCSLAGCSLGANETFFGTTGMIFEGATPDGFEGLLTVVDPTADRTWTLPNVSGNVVTTGDTSTVTPTMLQNTSVVAGTYAKADIVVDADGRITSASNGVLNPAFDLYVDKAGQDSVTCGSITAPCLTITGTNGANKKVLTNNDNGSITCTSPDNDIGCMRCSASSTKCNASPPWDTDCTSPQVCSPYTCADSSTTGCAFQCSVTTSQKCTVDTECPNREVCCTSSSKTGCTAGGATYGVCTFPFCVNGPRNGLNCVDDTDCVVSTCGTPSLTKYCSTKVTSSACAVCSGGTNNNVACTVASECPGGSCGYAETCAGPRKSYRVNINAGTFANECLNNSSATAAIPKPGYVTYQGVRKQATTLTCDYGSGISYDFTNRVGAGIRNMDTTVVGNVPMGSTGSSNFQLNDVSVNYVSLGANGKQCIGGTNEGAGCTVDSQCPSGRCALNAILQVSGRGNVTESMSNTWLFGVGSNAEGFLYENGPNFVCTSDVEKSCAADDGTVDASACGAGKCTSRTCSGARWKACHVDGDCTGSQGVCTENIMVVYAGSAITGSDDLYVDRMLFQPGTNGDGAAIDYIGRACGTTTFNERILNSLVLGDGGGSNTTTGIKVSRFTGSSGCPSNSPQLSVSDVTIQNGSTPYDTSVSVASPAQIIVSGPFSYDARSRSLGATTSITYADANANVWGGGMADLGVLNATGPATPMDGECWYSITNSGRYCRINGVTYQMATLTGTETFTNKTLTAPTINTPTITAPAIGASEWTNATHTHLSAATGGDLSTNYWPFAGVTGAKTAALSTNNNGTLTLAGGNGTGTLTVGAGSGNGTINGTTGSGGQLTLASTSNGTKGGINFGTSQYDDQNNRMQIGAANCTSPGNAPLCVTGDMTVSAAGTATNSVVGRTATQTLTNKTLTSPIISTISNTGTITLPTSTDTLVGKATTDTLTNKTLTDPNLGSSTLKGGTGTTDDLNLCSTSGTGATGALIQFQGGTNCATTFGTFLNDGSFGIGTSPTGFVHFKKDQAGDTIETVENASGSSLSSAQVKVKSDAAAGSIAAYNSAFFLGAPYADAIIVSSDSTASGGLGLMTGTTVPIFFAPNSVERGHITSNGHLEWTGTAPGTITAGCGNTATVTGNDMLGTVLIQGSSIGNSCGFTFNTSFGNAPLCTYAWKVNGGVTFTQMKVASTTTTATFSNFSTANAATNFTTADSFTYNCAGRY